MSGTETSEVVDSDVEEDFVISRPIQDVINRYEERVDEVKEEHDFLHLIKAESLKRQMTLYPSLELVKNQVLVMCLTVPVYF
jgi:predicted component of type VI protein secretion system